jgi:Response regulator containing CheY-like receiver, AAA-type ATPase, and DNA-binding domains
MVDDEVSVGFLSRMKFRQAIEDGSIELHFFEGARDCLKYLHAMKEHHGDMILFTDINMPSISGFDLLTQVKSQYPLIPVYMMSAYDDSASVDKSKHLGAKGYFTKPVNFGDIKKLLNVDFGVEF